MLPIIKNHKNSLSHVKNQENKDKFYIDSYGEKNSISPNKARNLRDKQNVEFNMSPEIINHSYNDMLNIESFGRLPLLRFLDLSSTAVTDEDLKEISSSKSIVKIFLENCKNITNISVLSSLLTLEEINLRGCSRVTNLGNLGKLPVMYFLDISQTSVTDNGLKGLSTSQNLVKLVIEECINLTSINSLISLKVITDISLRGCSQIKNLGGLGLLSSLNKLDISKTFITDSDLMGLGASRSLEKIFLEDCKMLSSVNAFTSIQSLKEIILRGCIRITSIGSLGTLSSLFFLDSSKTSITDEGLDGLGISLSLKKIYFEDCICLTTIYELTSILTLEEINIKGCNQISIIGPLGKLPMLLLLNSSKTSITDNGLQNISLSSSLIKIYLEDCIHLTNIMTLSSILTLEEIFIRGCIRLTNLGSIGLLPVLKSLDASKTAITDFNLRGLATSNSLRRIFLEDCENLCSVRMLSNLQTVEEIQLRGCSKLINVGPLGKLPVLSILNISKTPITDNGLEGLGESRSLSKIIMEDCKSLTSVISLTFIPTLTEISLHGCSSVVKITTISD